MLWFIEAVFRIIENSSTQSEAEKWLAKEVAVEFIRGNSDVTRNFWCQILALFYIKEIIKTKNSIDVDEIIPLLEDATTDDDIKEKVEALGKNMPWCIFSKYYLNQWTLHSQNSTKSSVIEESEITSAINTLDAEKMVFQNTPTVQGLKIRFQKILILSNNKNHNFFRDLIIDLITYLEKIFSRYPIEWGNLPHLHILIANILFIRMPIEIDGVRYNPDDLFGSILTIFEEQMQELLSIIYNPPTFKLFFIAINKIFFLCHTFEIDSELANQIYALILINLSENLAPEKLKGIDVSSVYFIFKELDCLTSNINQIQEIFKKHRILLSTKSCELIETTKKSLLDFSKFLLTDFVNSKIFIPDNLEIKHIYFLLNILKNMFETNILPKDKNKEILLKKLCRTLILRCRVPLGIDDAFDMLETLRYIIQFNELLNIEENVFKEILASYQRILFSASFPLERKNNNKKYNFFENSKVLLTQITVAFDEDSPVKINFMEEFTARFLKYIEVIDVSTLEVEILLNLCNLAIETFHMHTNFYDVNLISLFQILQNSLNHHILNEIEELEKEQNIELIFELLKNIISMIKIFDPLQVDYLKFYKKINEKINSLSNIPEEHSSFFRGELSSLVNVAKANIEILKTRNFNDPLIPELRTFVTEIESTLEILSNGLNARAFSGPIAAQLSGSCG